MLDNVKAISINYNTWMNGHTIAMCKRAGFDGVDLGFPEDFFADKKWEENIHKVKEDLDKEGMVCAQVHLPYYGIFESSELYREEKEYQILSTFKCMHILGAKWGAYHPMSSTNFDYDPKRAMADNKEKIKKYLEEASKYNVGIAVENLPIFPDCPQYNFFTSNYEDHCELVDSFHSELVGVCWDFGHANLMPYDKAKVLDIMGERVKIVHMHSNTEMCDMHIAPCLGTVKWEELVPILVKHKFTGAFTLEMNLKIITPQMKQAYIEFCSKSADELLKLG
jgi:sugar phosphate isomerase/epimerase